MRSTCGNAEGLFDDEKFREYRARLLSSYKSMGKPCLAYC
jgi:hypothetical protein